MLIETNDYVRVNQAGLILNVTRDAVYKMYRTGRLKHVNIAGTVFIDREAALEMRVNQRVGNRKPGMPWKRRGA